MGNVRARAHSSPGCSLQIWHFDVLSLYLFPMLIAVEFLHFTGLAFSSAIHIYFLFFLNVNKVFLVLYLSFVTEWYMKVKELEDLGLKKILCSVNKVKQEKLNM